MKLGVGFWSGANVDDPDALVAQLRALGVEGAGMLPPKEYTPEEIAKLRNAFEAASLFLGELTLYGAGWPLASADAKVRKEGLATIVRSLGYAKDMAAHCLGLSVIADEPCDPWAEKVWSRLVPTLGEVMMEAEQLGVDVSLHPGNRGPLDSPSQVRRMLDEVKSPRLKVMLDPVNMSNHRVCHNFTDFLNYAFDQLGDSIIGAHAKDLSINHRHWVTRIDEVPPGTGLLDYEVYLQRLDQLNGEIIFTIEHLRDVGVSGTVVSPNFVYFNTDNELKRARDYIHGVADRIGVAIE